MNKYKFTIHTKCVPIIYQEVMLWIKIIQMNQIRKTKIRIQIRIQMQIDQTNQTKQTNPTQVTITKCKREAVKTASFFR